MSIIEANGLSRTFRARGRTVEAVRGVDLTVDAGEIVGFLGPNGAGKTTTLRMLTTLLRPTGGTAVVAGRDLLSDPAGVRRRIGYVAQSGGTDGNCLVAEELVLQARLYRINASDAQRRAVQLTGRLDLTGLERRLVRTLSGGQRRRLDIALGLVHEPEVVFLDEPTAGLDPQSRTNLWDHVRRLRDELRTTVFMTTHYLEEADALCDRILIVDGGRLVAAGTPEQLKRRVAGDVVTLRVGGDADAAKHALAGHPAVREITIADGCLRLAVEHGEEALAGLIGALDGTGARLLAIQLARPTLDDVFLTLTGRSLRDDTPDRSTP